MAEQKMKTVAAQKNLQTYFCPKTPYESNIHLKVGDEVLVYTEREMSREARSYKIASTDYK